MLTFLTTGKSVGLFVTVNEFINGSILVLFAMQKKCNSKPSLVFLLFCLFMIECAISLCSENKKLSKTPSEIIHSQ